MPHCEIHLPCLFRNCRPRGRGVERRASHAPVMLQSLLVARDSARQDIATQVEAILADVIFAYRQNPPSYNWETKELDIEGAEEATMKAIQHNVDEAKMRLLETEKALKEKAKKQLL